MSKKESMLFELMETCNFPDVFEHCSEAPDSLQLDLCQYFRQKKLKGYAAVLSSSSSFCCGVI